MNEAQKSQRSKNEKIVIAAVLIVILVGISYMAYDYVTTMEQLDDLKTESNENLSLTENSNIDSVGNDDDT
ncbi:MAG: hypothetical protein ACRBBZ_07870 [Nitrosopumilus sp.]